MGHVQHDPIRTAVLDLDIAVLLTAMPYAQRLVHIIARLGAGCIVSWPVSATALTLQSASNLAAATAWRSVTIAATVPASSPVQTMQLYVDNSLAYSVGGQSLSKTLALASGPHYIVIKAWDATGINWFTGENITVQ